METTFKLHSPAVWITPRATALALGQVLAAPEGAFLPELDVLDGALRIAGIPNADQFTSALSELRNASSQPENLENTRKKLVAVLLGIDDPEVWKEVQGLLPLIILQTNARQTNARRFAPSGSIGAVFRSIEPVSVPEDIRNFFEEHTKPGSPLGQFVDQSLRVRSWTRGQVLGDVKTFTKFLLERFNNAVSPIISNPDSYGEEGVFTHNPSYYQTVSDLIQVIEFVEAHGYMVIPEDQKHFLRNTKEILMSKPIP